MNDLFCKRYDIFERKDRLSMAVEIPDMRQYAAEWLALADEFQAVNMLSNAEYCRSRGNHYAAIAGGAYVRMVDGCLAEIMPVKNVA